MNGLLSWRNYYLGINQAQAPLPGIGFTFQYCVNSSSATLLMKFLCIGEEEGVGLPISSSMSRSEKVKALQDYLQDLEQEINAETESLKVNNYQV